MQKLEIVREKIESKYRVVKSDVDLEWNRAIDLCMNIINAQISRENTPEITRSPRDNDVTEYCPHCDREITVSWNVDRDGLDKILEEIEAEHPYKVPGNYDSYSQYNEAWSDAIDRVRARLENYFKEKENDGWIKVKDRLPIPNKEVWVTVRRNGNVFTSTDIMTERGYFLNYENGNILAWKEKETIPEPYRPERSTNEKE